MLSLTIRNIFTDKHDVADYHWELRVNARLLASGAVYEHPRHLGAAQLLDKVVSQVALKGLDREAVGGEEENPLLTQDQEVKTQRTT